MQRALDCRWSDGGGRGRRGSNAPALGQEARQRQSPQRDGAGSQQPTSRIPGLEQTAELCQSRPSSLGAAAKDRRMASPSIVGVRSGSAASFLRCGRVTFDLGHRGCRGLRAPRRLVGAELARGAGVARRLGRASDGQAADQVAGENLELVGPSQEDEGAPAIRFERPVDIALPHEEVGRIAVLAGIG